MTDRADVAVIGRGLFGTAAARHLTELGQHVALIGPDEPSDPTAFDGPFASHHDAARITRRIAHDADWARLSSRSIDRYAALKEASGIPFYRPVGALATGPDTGPGAAYVAETRTVAAAAQFAHTQLEPSELGVRFPVFDFAEGTRGVFDPAGGTIDPRALRRAEEVLAVRDGARVYRDAAVALRGRDITLASGSTLSAGAVLVATGGYAAIDGMLAAPPAMEVYARTILFVEISPAEAAELAEMPAVIFWPDGCDHTLYLLPPVRYPDGRWLIKIGGEGDGPRITNSAEARAWFQGAGNAQIGDRLERDLRRLMPNLRGVDRFSGSCAVSYTESGFPFIGRVSDGVALLTGGCGAGAKSCDEIGRLGALAALGQDLKDQGYAADFTPAFAKASAEA